MADSGGRVVSLDAERRRRLDRALLPLRLAPEIDDFHVLYSNRQHHNKLFSLRILAWALRDDGTVDALIPWMNRIQYARTLRDSREGQWAGYYLPASETVLDTPPAHKTAELEAAAAYFNLADHERLPQALPDTTGTCALLYDRDEQTLRIAPVHQWHLFADGDLQGEIVLDGPEAGGTAAWTPTHPDFRYYLHETVADELFQSEQALNRLLEALHR